MVRCVIAIILCVPYAAALSALCPSVARSRTRARLHARGYVCCSLARAPVRALCPTAVSKSATARASHLQPSSSSRRTVDTGLDHDCRL